MKPLVLAGAAAQWLAAGVLDGSLLAGVAWLLSVTLLARATGRVYARVWLLVLAEFVIVRPFEMRTLPLRPSLERAVAVAATGPSLAWPAIGYGAVVLFLLVRLTLRQRRLRRCIAGYALAEPVIAESLRTAGTALSLALLPEVRVTEARVGPFSVGPTRPVLVLPRWLCVPGARLDAVLLHELAHLKRRDHWYLWFERLVVSVFFFWPPVYWVSRKLDEARELACDERAVEHGALCPAEYGRQLLEVVAVARGLRTPGVALAIGCSTSRLERRIDRLLEQGWSRRPSWREGAGLLLLGACSLLALRPAPEPPSPPLARLVAAPPTAPTPSENAANMSIDPSLDRLAPPAGGCVLQGCGTACAP